METALLVIAKQPIPGRVKTRLTPPCSPAQAALLAEVALLDTVSAVARARAGRRVMVFDGVPPRWMPAGFDVIPQRDGGLGNRLDGAFAAVGGPAFLVGMDTPQVFPSLLESTAGLLATPGVDAVIAPTFDGGYWCVGFNGYVPGAFDGVPMSTEDTYERQLDRFASLGLTVAIGAPLRDVDTIDDARIVALEAPGTQFALALSQLGLDAAERAA